jgi:ABC-type antimicrobial peptide transport system permease subunit
MAEPVMHAVGALDRDLAVTRVAPMEMVIAEDVAADKLLAGMMSGFALAAVLITTIGLYGLISYAVAQRTREFGIRRALGAEARALAALVLGQGLRLAALGAAIGSAVALAVMRLMRALLFGVSPADPLTLVAVASAMCAIGVAAAYAPARRATRVDPMLSLREE